MDLPPLSNILGAAAVVAVVWFITGILKHRGIAKQIGLPYIYFPVAEDAKYYAFAATPLGRWIVFKLIPKSLRVYAFHSTSTWRWNAKYDMHGRYGDVLATVTPGSVEIHVADADVIWDMATSRRFFKDAAQYAVLDLFGENVVTTEGPTWARHRKHTSRPFSERNNSLVWRETLSQAQGMLRKWDTFTTGAHADVHNFQEDVRSLALNVISAAGFGVHLSFDKNTSKDEVDSESVQDEFFSDRYIPPGYQRNYRDALASLSEIMIRVLIVTNLFSDETLKKAPHFLRKYYHAKTDVRNYLLKLISNERAKISGGASNEGRSNLLSMLIQEGEDDDADKIKPFTDEEIIGNTFIFSIAGHETTASTLQIALALLSLHPDKQAWLHRKIDEALVGQSDNPSEWPYALFERLTGPLSVMFETLRLYPVVPVIPRMTASAPTTITWDNRNYVLPPRSLISYNIPALQYNPKYWGPDATAFDPTRWDPSNKSSYLHRFKSSDSESGATELASGLLKPRRGAFVPFSEGVRGCLGKKFAQIEFVAALTALLRKRRVEIAPLAGESEEDVKNRARAVLESCCNQGNLHIAKFGIRLSAR
ncbi:hypothetical protein AX16_005669 [Volvariella volvacea WC 439]|nr:hypothetical protein AX16_005669 [Volvariella volvacea WC 439]